MRNRETTCIAKYKSLLLSMTLNPISVLIDPNLLSKFSSSLLHMLAPNVYERNRNYVGVNIIYFCFAYSALFCCGDE